MVSIIKIINITLVLVLLILVINLIQPLDNITGNLIYYLDASKPKCLFKNIGNSYEVPTDRCCYEIQKQLMCKLIDKKIRLFKCYTYDSSKKLFRQKRYKDAYGKAGQALRLFLSYENKLNKEITNDEIINYLRCHKKEFKEAKECFDLCSLVEFAKYKANKKDFDKIINYAKKIIK